MKFYKGLGLWLLSLCNGISFVTLALATLHSGNFSITGFYYNPGDKHMLVPNRLQSGNYAFNYANKKARACTVFLTVFLIGCTVFTLAALLPLSHVEVKTSFSEETFTVSAGGYKTKVPRPIPIPSVTTGAVPMETAACICAATRCPS